jgi:hypothetical protein
MKSSKYQKRFYRDWVGSKDLYLTRLALKETDLQVLTDKPVDKNFLKERIHLYRRQIENYIAKDNRFLATLKPIAVELTASAIVKEMANAAKKANVGPMAAVAGAIAGFLGRDLARRGYKDIIIENGGDIFLKSKKIRQIKIYAGKSKLGSNLKISIKPQDTPLGICTSSGTLGHSLSFGLTDATIILARSASLADAVATATANRVKNKDDLKKGIDFAKSIKGVIGAIIIIKNNIICWGKVRFVAKMT